MPVKRILKSSNFVNRVHWIAYNLHSSSASLASERQPLLNYVWLKHIVGTNDCASEVKNLIQQNLDHDQTADLFV